MKEKILKFGNKLFYTLRFHSTGDLFTTDTYHALGMSLLSFLIGLGFMFLGTFFPPLLINALIFMLLSLMNVFGLLFLIVGAPFRTVRKFLTHCEYSNIKRASIEQNWKPIHWIIYGIFGHLIYIIWLFLLFTLTFAYKPTNNNTGYIIPTAIYNEGDIVAVDDSYGTIVSNLDYDRYTVLTPEGAEIITSTDKYDADYHLRGYYREYDTFIEALCKSFCGLFTKITYNIIEFIKAMF